MSLREKINEQLKTALKNKSKNLVSTLRLVLAAIKDKDIENRTSESKKPANNTEIIKVLRKMQKQRQDSAKLYKEGGRQELLDIELEEIKIIDSFLPKQLDDNETKKICEDLVKELGASSIKDIGKIMGALKKEYSETIDFSKASIILKGLLNK
jgi:uncharacterized protein YqeY